MKIASYKLFSNFLCSEENMCNLEILFLSLIPKFLLKDGFYAVKFSHFQYLSVSEQNLEASEQHR